MARKGGGITFDPGVQLENPTDILNRNRNANTESDARFDSGQNREEGGMTISPASFIRSYYLKLQAATERWYAQVFLYLVLVVVFFVIDQLVLADLYLYYFRGSHFWLNWIFMAGNWIPAFSNVIVIVVATRARTLIAYSVSVAFLTYLLAVPYYYLSGGEARYGHDPWGAAGLAIVWLFFIWFWSEVAALAIKYIMWRKAGEA